MIESAEVLLWGSRVGVVYREEGTAFAKFSFDSEFRSAGVEPSPLMMPVAEKVYEFPDLPEKSFHGLPGMLSDSVPDKFGNAVIDIWLQANGRSPGSMSPVERLCYTGSRGMGALEYRPVLMESGDGDAKVRVESLARLADEVLKCRTGARAELKPSIRKYSSILKVGSSAGGARAKALIGWNETTGEVRSGQVKLPRGFGYWLIKFDGLEGNGDKEGDDKWGYGRVEQAYHLMARAAGVEMSECRLWNHRHFMTRRFDRTPAGDKLHMQTLGALAHLDFNDPLSYSYEQAFRITRKLVRDVRACRQLYRRMVFNVLAWNCDDHVKNISYLMDREGRWSLAPAYDLCYAYNPEGDWTNRHQMSVNGKRIGITASDLIEVGRYAELDAHDAKAVVDEVRDAVHSWPRFAEKVAVPENFKEIGARLCACLKK